MPANPSFTGALWRTPLLAALVLLAAGVAFPGGAILAGPDRVRLMVRVGEPGTRQEAERTVRRLRRAGIEAASIRRPAGTVVSAGLFVRPENAVRRHRQVRDQGLSPVRLEPLDQTPDRGLPPEAPWLVQVQMGAPGPLPRSRQLAADLRSKGIGALPVRSSGGFTVSAGVFDIPANALRRREQLRASGYSGSRLVALPREGGRSPEERPPGGLLRLHMVRLESFPDWDSALVQAARLLQSGFPARVFTVSGGEAAAVSVGDYPRQTQALGVVWRLRRAGFRQGRVRTVRVALPSAEPERAPSGEGDLLVLGEPREGAAPSPGKPAEPGALRIGPEELRLEGGPLLDPGPVASHQYLHADLRLRWRPTPAWTLRVAGRADGYRQGGSARWSDWELGPGETFLRYRGDYLRLTAGYQKVLWGRIDELPPTDGLGVRDLRRFILDDYADRRLPGPALRAEVLGGPASLDLVWVPRFRPADLPERESLWSPVDRRRGRISGLPPDPVLAALVREGTFGKEDTGSGGGGARLELTGRRVDGALTVQRIRRSAPYYELDPAVRGALAAGQPPGAALGAGDPTFTERHPWTWLAGGDLAFEGGGAVWRAEAAWRSDVPVTTPELALDTAEALDWAAGAEWYPGEGSARLNVQMVGRDLLEAGEVLDIPRIRTLSGTLAWPFAHARWRARLRFLLGLNRHQTYLHPQLAYRGLEPHSFFIGVHLFEGHPATPVGFHGGHDLAVLGWRARF